MVRAVSQSRADIDRQDHLAAHSDRKPVNLVGRQPVNDQSAKRHYERYLELALAEARSGNTIAAENYYQHAEHYYRTMGGLDS